MKMNLRFLALAAAVCSRLITTSAADSKIGDGSKGLGESVAGDTNANARTSQPYPHEPNEAQLAAVANQLPEPAATVFSKYTRIQLSLANDSLAGLLGRAHAIAMAVKSNASDTFSASVVRQAEELGEAVDMPAARKAFKALSQSLIEYRAKNPQVAALYRRVHCPKADVDWLQPDSVVRNPYLGKVMANCGEFVNGSHGAQSNQSLPAARAVGESKQTTEK